MPYQTSTVPDLCCSYHGYSTLLLVVQTREVPCTREKTVCRYGLRSCACQTRTSKPIRHALCKTRCMLFHSQDLLSVCTLRKKYQSLFLPAYLVFLETLSFSVVVTSKVAIKFLIS